MQGIINSNRARSVQSHQYHVRETQQRNMDDRHTITQQQHKYGSWVLRPHLQTKMKPTARPNLPQDTPHQAEGAAASGALKATNTFQTDEKAALVMTPRSLAIYEGMPGTRARYTVCISSIDAVRDIHFNYINTKASLLQET